MDMIKFKVVLPVLEDKDVVSRELAVQVADLPPIVLNVDVAATEVVGDELVGEQGASVSLSLVDVDDAGNRSEASVLSVVLSDTFPPAKPGEMGVIATGEEIL